jgi:Cu(I)/Ag(I) efflux system membrane protein CusA/SilA
MGYSFIYVILANGAERARVQQLVTDRINAIRPQLPPDAVVTLGPNASSMGWIYQYALVDSEKLRDLRELRMLNEGQIKPALQGVPGIAEVASVGGLEKQYQVRCFHLSWRTLVCRCARSSTRPRACFRRSADAPSR